MGRYSFDGSIGAPVTKRIDNAAATGDLTVVPAVAGQRVRVYALRLTVAGATIVTVRDGATLLERFNFAGNGGGVSFDMRDIAYYITSPGNALIISSTGAFQVDGVVEYSQG